MPKYEIPASPEDRETDLNKFFDMYRFERQTLKEKGKKAAGGRAKKALSIIKRLITLHRKDIQEEINNIGTKARVEEAVAPTQEAVEAPIQTEQTEEGTQETQE